MSYLGVLVLAIVVIVSLSAGSLAGAQENSDQDQIGGRITDPVEETLVGEGENIGGRITDPVEETPVSGDQYDGENKIGIPEPVNVGETTPVEQGPGAPLPEPVNVGETTPVEQQPAADSGETIGGRITDPVEETPVTELPDTGGPSGLMLLGGALLLGSGLVVRRIVR
jgi:LPXTG-motif cell wall-anchored protein